MVASYDGYMPFKGYKTYYRVFGSPKSTKPPLLVLHGGPGSAHNYLLGLNALTQTGRQVIYYDQLGCGKSDQPDDESLWQIPLFIEEVVAIRNTLNLKKIHLLGHSWGGMLAIEYLLTQPKGIKSAILASPMISMPLYQTEVDKLKRALPGDTYAIMKKHEENGTTASKEYAKAYELYGKHYLFSGSKFPEKYSSHGTEGDSVYKKMWGVSEAYGNGTMKDWDKIEQLPKIKVPCLITSGQYDELTPWQAGIAGNQIPHSQIKIFTNGTHLVHIEQEELYLQTVAEFLQ
jgi:proline-specific peptidase